MSFEQDLKERLAEYDCTILIISGNRFVTSMDDSPINYSLMFQIEEHMESLGYKMIYTPRQLSSLVREIPEVRELYKRYSPSEKLFVVEKS